MKTSAIVLVLLALFALCMPCMAEPEAAAPAVSSVTTATAPANLDDFLATLSPNPQFLSTVCTDNSDCPPGQLCCYPCGIDGCNFVCMTTWRNHCPPIP